MTTTALLEPQKIVVLGSNSFTGSHFVDFALRQSDAQVIGLSRSAEYHPVFLPYLYHTPRSSRFTFHRLDVNTNFNEVTRLLDREQPDVIVNYAAQGEVRNSWKNPEQWFQTNCTSVVRLGEFLKDKTYLQRYVHISTPEIYGATGEKIKEHTSFQPSTPYGVSKLAGELFLMTLFRKHGFPLVMTRSANVYGMHQQLYRIIPRTIIYLKQGRKIPLHGGGKQVRSFIHVRDVAAATGAIISKGKNGEAYHLAPEGEDLSIHDLVAVICRMMGTDFAQSVEISPETFGQDERYSLDCTKAHQELGWKPSISLEQGIQEMIRWITDNWDFIQAQPLEYIHKA